MKFLRDKQLKHLGAYLVILTLIAFVVQYFIVDYKIKLVEQAELKIEYTQVAQLNNQKISLQVQHFLNGDKLVAPSIMAKIEEQEYHLKTLSDGGRMGKRDEFITPLNRLSKVTFGGLKENWESYKLAVLFLLGGDDALIQPVTTAISTAPSVETLPDLTDSEIVSTSDSLVDVTNKPEVEVIANSSAEAISLLVRKNTSVARLQYEGLSLTMNDWFENLVTDLEEEVKEKKTDLTQWKVGLLLFNILLLSGIYLLFFSVVLKPLSRLQKSIIDHKRTDNLSNNEIGQLAHSVNETIENLRDATDFVSAIGQGNLTLDYKEALDAHYEPGKNRLADSLIEMQTKLRVLNEEEQKRQWANEGVGKFVEILRSSNDDLTILGNRIISTLIHYTRSNQGALYILNDEDTNNKYLELISLFAWDIRKHEQQKIKPGQGILGQTFLEKETTYLTSLPEEYIRITSGLGGASPKAILIVPLKVDKDVYGLVELASFNEYQPHEIAFIEKLGETIASTLASVRSSHKNKLLIQQFQQQTEQMRAQEEEMRQNMEELQATQEEVVRKEKSYVSRIATLEDLVNQRSDPEQTKQLEEKCRSLEKEYNQKVAALTATLEQKTNQANESVWAEELNKALRVNLEALRITQEELGKKTNA